VDVNQLLVSVVDKKGTGHVIVLNLQIIVKEVAVEEVEEEEEVVVMVVVLRPVVLALVLVQDLLVKEEAAGPQETEDQEGLDRVLLHPNEETDPFPEALPLAKDREVLLIARNVHDLFQNHQKENSEDQDHHHLRETKMVG